MLRNAETDPILVFPIGGRRFVLCRVRVRPTGAADEMAQARAMVRANFGNQLSPEQEAYLTAMLYQRMESDRLFGKPTPLLFAFDLRFLVEHPECINSSPADGSNAQRGSFRDLWEAI